MTEKRMQTILLGIIALIAVGFTIHYITKPTEQEASLQRTLDNLNAEKLAQNRKEEEAQRIRAKVRARMNKAKQKQ